MKIGILTIYPFLNYGGILQLYALQKVLKKKGHEAWIINRQRNRMPYWRLPLTYAKRFILKNLFKKEINIFYEKEWDTNYRKIGSHIIQFKSNYYQPQTPPVFNLRMLKKLCKTYGFQAFIVGSDQIWRPKYAQNVPEAYFLGFTKNIKNIKRLSYAASFGTDEWEYNDKETLACRELVNMFDAVSVREESAVLLCKSKFGINAVHTLDPTMLLEKKDYINLIENAGTKESSGNLLVYYIDLSDDKVKAICKISEMLKLVPFKINIPKEDIISHTKIDIPIASPVEEWLRGFYDSRFVITDSFHGTVFSIIFNKPFIVYGNVDRGMSRFDSLLRMFGLEDRMINSFSELNNRKIFDPIDWVAVNNIIDKHRILSKEFIDSNLDESLNSALGDLSVKECSYFIK